MRRRPSSAGHARCPDQGQRPRGAADASRAGTAAALFQERTTMADQRDDRRTPSSTAGPEREATEVEREGMDLLGRSSVRNGAIDGVSDPVQRADLSAQSDDRAGTGGGAGPVQGRREPEFNPHAGTEDGGLSASGGVAGGARGNTGRSDTSGDPNSPEPRPSQASSTSRTDLDHPSRREQDGPGRGHRSDA
jgi:hypothetical protein